MDRPPGDRFPDDRKVHRLPSTFSTRPSVPGPTGNRRPAEICRGHPALEAVGRFHRHRADAILAEVLLHLDDDVEGIVAGLAGDPNGVVDRGQLPAWKFDVDHWSDDLDDAAGGGRSSCGS